MVDKNLIGYIIPNSQITRITVTSRKSYVIHVPMIYIMEVFHRCAGDVSQDNILVYEP